MKYNYLIFLVVFLIVLFRSSLVVLLNNINKSLFTYNENIEIKELNNKYDNLSKEYNSLLTFKNNINIKENYIISNVYKNNHGFDKLLINGVNYNIGDEVINENGLIGIINKIYDKYSEISYLYDTNIPVIMNNYEGKIVGRDKDNNLIIKEVSNYNNINKNDLVFSVYGTYIGKVILKNTSDIDSTIIVKINIKDIKYVAVIKRQV